MLGSCVAAQELVSVEEKLQTAWKHADEADERALGAQRQLEEHKLAVKARASGLVRTATLDSALHCRLLPPYLRRMTSATSLPSHCRRRSVARAGVAAANRV